MGFFFTSDFSVAAATARGVVDDGLPSSAESSIPGVLLPLESNFLVEALPVLLAASAGDCFFAFEGDLPLLVGVLALVTAGLFFAVFFPAECTGDCDCLLAPAVGVVFAVSPFLFAGDSEVLRGGDWPLTIGGLRFDEGEVDEKSAKLSLASTQLVEASIRSESLKLEDARLCPLLVPLLEFRPALMPALLLVLLLVFSGLLLTLPLLLLLLGVRAECGTVGVCKVAFPSPAPLTPLPSPPFELLLPMTLPLLVLELLVLSSLLSGVCFDDRSELALGAAPA